MDVPFPLNLPASSRLAGALILLISFGAHADTPPPSPVDPATIDVDHPTGHVHDHGHQTWPPQPQGIRNSVILSSPDEERRVAGAREGRTDTLERIAIARPEVRQALGERFARVALVENRAKSGAALPARLVYFSHSNNTTVEVILDGQRVRGVRKIPPTEYQPEITDAEIAAAEGITRAHFAALGENDVAGLQAFGILAYLPTGTGFFETRVLYVSFHRDSDAPPEYVAWVDLSRQTVLRARREGQ